MVTVTVDLARLDAQQRAAVESPIDDAALVLAGAGSGKTLTLTTRVAWLVNQGVDPSRIVACTFGRKAADEMKERLVPLIGDAVNQLMVNTIHGLCLGILADEGLAKEVISITDQRKILEAALSEANWDVGWKYPLYWIRRAKVNLVEPDKAEWFLAEALSRVAQRYQAEDTARRVARVYRFYERERSLQKLMDFDDMLMWVGLRLRRDRAFRQRWQSRIDYVLVDELQDTSRLSVEILETLAAPQNRLFGVGDDFQSLYRFNCADPAHNVFGFLGRTPGHLYKIETNYRSTQRLVSLGNALGLAQYSADSEFRKELKARPGATEGDEVEIGKFEDVYGEASWVADGIEQNQFAPGDVFCLYRMNCQSRVIEDELIRRGIPYIIMGSLGFYDRAVVKDVVAYLRLVEDEHSDEAFQRVANIASIFHGKHYRGFGKVFYRECTEAGERSLWEGMLRIRDRQTSFKRAGIEDLVSLIEILRTEGEKKPARTVALIREYCYDEWLRRKEGVAEGDEDTQAFDDLAELVEAASAFPTIKAMLEHVDMIQEMKARQDKKMEMECVVLATIHRIKGMERKVVFGVGMVDGVLPHWRSDPSIFPDLHGRDVLPTENTSSVEEERCAAYVLVTRAKERLFLSCPMEWRGRAVSPSRFLYEMGLLSYEAEGDTDEKD